MSEDNDHVKTLVEGLDLLVNRRRVLAVQLLKKKATAEFVGVQNAIAAVEEAIKHERSLAARPQKIPVTKAVVVSTPRTTPG
jgi:hypothetical protein